MKSETYRMYTGMGGIGVPETGIIWHRGVRCGDLYGRRSILQLKYNVSTDVQRPWVYWARYSLYHEQVVSALVWFSVFDISSLLSTLLSGNAIFRGSRKFWADYNFALKGLLTVEASALDPPKPDCTGPVHSKSCHVWWHSYCTLWVVNLLPESLTIKPGTRAAKTGVPRKCWSVYHDVLYPFAFTKLFQWLHHVTPVDTPISWLTIQSRSKD